MKVMRWIGVAVLAASCALAGEALAGAEGKASKAEARININEASKADLMKLAGVGPATAEKIIAYRQAHGRFKRAEDLEKVEGVGKGVLERNLERITVK